MSPWVSSKLLPQVAKDERKMPDLQAPNILKQLSETYNKLDCYNIMNNLETIEIEDTAV